jgi:hypothetical protein
MNQTPSQPEIRHFSSCRPDYPEKVPGETARQITSMDIGDGEWVFTCVDCGSSVVVDLEGREVKRDL